MTLDEAIKHAEEVAEENEINAQLWHKHTVNRLVEFCANAIQEENKCQKCAEEHRQLAEWLKELKQLREQTRWIPVSERLPKEDGQYLITVKYKPEADYEDIYAEHGEWTDGQWDMFCFGHCGEVEDIIAWMPLPEPYNAESEVEE